MKSRAWRFGGQRLGCRPTVRLLNEIMHIAVGAAARGTTRWGYPNQLRKPLVMGKSPDKFTV